MTKLDDLQPQDESFFRKWYPDCHNPILHEAKGVRSPITLDDDEIEKPRSIISTSLTLLKRIVDRVDNPSVAVSLLDIVGLTQELGVLLLNSSENLSLNSEVFEDPLNRGDALGNVLMIHKRLHAKETLLLESLGRAILGACDEVLQNSANLQRSYLDWDSLYIEPFDDTSSEEVLAAKKIISSLRRENSRLDRRNAKLYTLFQDTRISKSKLRLRVLCSLQMAKSLPPENVIKFLKSKLLTRGQALNAGESMRNNLDRTRNSIVDEADLDLQTDCLKW